MDWRARLLAPVSVLLGRSKVAERTTQRYPQDVNSASCIVDRNKALVPLIDDVDHINEVFARFVTTDSRGKRLWNESDLAKYLDAR